MTMRQHGTQDPDVHMTNVAGALYGREATGDQFALPNNVAQAALQRAGYVNGSASTPTFGSS